MKTKNLMLMVAAVLLGACAWAATPETATGSSAYFHVCTSNETVKIENVVCKYCDGEYGKGKGRHATFLNGVSLRVDFTMNAENDDVEDPIHHYIVNKEIVDIPSFTIDVGQLAIGYEFEVKAVTRDGAESKPFRVNFDIAKIPGPLLSVGLMDDLKVVETDDSVLYQKPEIDSFSFFEGLDGVFKLPQLVDAASRMSAQGATIKGAGFNWVPEVKMASVMDSSTGKVMTGIINIP